MSELFGPWLDQPEGEGIHHFIGVRFTSRHRRIPSDDLVEVRHEMSIRGRMEFVHYFGRSTRFPLPMFRGVWRKLNIQFKEKS